MEEETEGDLCIDELKRGRGRPKKTKKGDKDTEKKYKKGGRGCHGKAVELSSQEDIDNNNIMEIKESIGKRGRGRPKGSTKKRKKTKKLPDKKQEESFKESSYGYFGTGDIETD